MIEANKLQRLISEQDVAKENAKQLIAAFGAPFTEAGEIIDKVYEQDEEGNLVLRSDALKVTNAAQVAEMNQAREERLTLKKIRTNVEKKRKELKEDALRTGKAIDGVARYIKSVIEPTEKYLELQEKYVEIQQKAEIERKCNERAMKLSQYDKDSSMYNLEMMSDEQFDELIKQLDAAREKAEAEAKAEEERQKAEAAKKAAEEAKAKAEAERIRKENEKLKAEAAKIKAEAEAKEKAEREAAEAKAKQERAEAEARAKAEREKAEAEEKERQRVASIRESIYAFGENLQTVDTCRINYVKVQDAYEALPEADQKLASVEVAYEKTKLKIAHVAEGIKKAEAEAKAKALRSASDDEKIAQYAKSIQEFSEANIPNVTTEEAIATIAKMTHYLHKAIDLAKK